MATFDVAAVRREVNGWRGEFRHLEAFADAIWYVPDGVEWDADSPEDDCTQIANDLDAHCARSLVVMLNALGPALDEIDRL